MKLLIDIGHPAHIHFFKNMIWELENRGDKVKITARDKDVILNLLNSYSFEYENLGKHYPGMREKAYGMIKRDYKLYRLAKKFKPDVLTGIHNPYIAHVGKLIRKPSITFTDTEYVGIASKLTFPFTDAICTPSCFREKLNPKKHVKYNGYHELAYLHPKYFKADSEVIEDIGLSKNEPFIILRFISWGAAHDTSLKGFIKGSEKEYVKHLEKYGKVFITSESKLNKELENYRLPVAPYKIHSLLKFASLYIGEGGTMAAEAGILGTPSIHIETSTSEKPSATRDFSGNFMEFEEKYKIVYSYENQEKALEKAAEILENKNWKKEWKKKKEKLLNDKIDVTAWMTDFIERYPESFYEYEMKKNEKNDIPLS